VVEIEEVDENCSKLQNCGGGFGSIFGRNFASVFELDFAPFLAFVRFAICLFYGTFSMSKVVFGPFSDVFWTVLLVTILPTLATCRSSACWLASAYRSCGRREVLFIKGPEWLLAAWIAHFPRCLF
jgi:hypothetical protein